MTNIEASQRLISRLDNVKGTGQGAYVASCPAPGHGQGRGDKNPSLSVRQIDNQALVYCHAGCSTDEVLAALNLELRDLYDNGREVRWEYRGVENDLVRTVVRTADKKFRQSIQDKTIIPLLHLAEVTAAVKSGKPVYICEGEKDASVARSLGHVGTTSPQGASSWHKADYTPLIGAAELIVVQDKDEPGRKRGTGLVKALRELTPSSNIRLVEAAQGKDLADHVMAGEPVEKLVEVSVPLRGRRVVLTPASQVKIYRQAFLLDPLIPLETITVISGRGGEGKSTLALHWAALGTRGLLPGEFHGEPIKVAVSAHEDTKSMQTARLKAAGANLDHVYFVDVHDGDLDNPLEVGIKFPLDRERIEQQLEEADVKLWIIDPVLNLVEGKTGRDQDIRAALEPLHAVAARLGIAVLGIAHFNKGEGNSGQKLSGSHAIRDVIRSHIPLVLDEESGNRVYTLEKSNYSDQRGQSWQFDLQSRDVNADDGSIINVGVVQDLGESPISVDQIINRPPDHGDEEERNAAQTFLIDYITEQGGEAAAGDVIKAGRAAGFNEGEIKDARRRSKDPKISTQKSGGKGGSWVWAIATFDFPAPSSQKVDLQTVKVAPGPTSKDHSATLAVQTPTFPRDTNEKPKVATKDSSATLEGKFGSRSCNKCGKSTPDNSGQLKVCRHCNEPFDAELLGTIAGTDPTYGPVAYTKDGFTPSDPVAKQSWIQAGRPDLQLKEAVA